MEVITVVTIIAILVGILLPSITKVRTMVRETEQRAQLATIGLAISGFKNDYGDYPASDWYYLSNGQHDYSGAQMLAEALVGWDLMGFHPRSAWRADGRDENNQPLYQLAVMGSLADRQKNLEERKGPYLENGSAVAFKIGDLFKSSSPQYFLLAPDTYVICDVFRFRKVSTPSGGLTQAGAPILYYKAKPSNKSISLSITDAGQRTYDYRDNNTLVKAKMYYDNNIDKKKTTHPVQDSAGNYQFFYEQYIKDPKAAGDWPYRPDSYLLISAGADGQYGTRDDITNFK